jgi:hypothetical protein
LFDAKYFLIPSGFQYQRPSLKRGILHIFLRFLEGQSPVDEEESQKIMKVLYILIEYTFSLLGEVDDRGNRKPRK